MAKTAAIATTTDNPFGGLARIGGPSVDDMVPIAPSGPGVRYVNFYTTKAKKAAEITNALPGINPGNPYISDPDKGFQSLRTFKFHLVDRTEHWVLRDGENKPIKASKKKPPDGSPLRENIEALIIVYTDDGKVVPAIATFNTAKAKAVRVANDAIAKAAEPEWFNKSPDHKNTAQVPDPRYRFTATVNSWVQPAKGSGFPTVHARSIIKPITPGELSVLVEATKDPKFAEEMEMLQGVFAAKRSELDKLAAANG